MILRKQRHKPGSAVQRFGDWRKGEPQVLLDNQTWRIKGRPDEVKVEFLLEKSEIRQLDDHKIGKNEKYPDFIEVEVENCII